MTCFDDQGDVRNLRPDRVVTMLNGHKVLVEVDGPHHFGVFSYYGGTLTDFEDQVRRDKAKEEQAWENGWSIIRISYLEFPVMEMWMNVLLERVFTSGKQVRLNSNNDLYDKLYTSMYK
jgi:very-short-patch-repair endonuclease